ncbi:hypothetical protein CS022_24290 [Veronia nyctiphanis]|uniref:Uncharacterized protein n=1 Tax=Veronia nyctiphanis TaxID=1278244 RepID=A0A4Q0YGX6_9GAMM|nr:hypothetical protein [Veronia nyctiphanis]RXJ68051.1 hypothetical protein CS022_24290 [Veronia nyctiphanis]
MRQAVEVAEKLPAMIGNALEQIPSVAGEIGEKAKEAIKASLQTAVDAYQGALRFSRDAIIAAKEGVIGASEAARQALNTAITGLQNAVDYSIKVTEQVFNTLENLPEAAGKTIEKLRTELKAFISTLIPSAGSQTNHNVMKPEPRADNK